MKQVLIVIVSLVVLLSPGASAQDSKAAATPAAHVALQASDLKWMDAPPILPKGAMLTVLSGDPSQPGPFVIRLKMPAGYRVPPHWHPTAENLTVIEGVVMVGMGDQFDAEHSRKLGPGGFALLPAEMHHYAGTKDGATVQVHGIGPFALTYVNPADDPSKPAAK